jgi:hypothetical protein
MRRVPIVFLLALCSMSLGAQSSSSDSTAVAFAKRSIAALVGQSSVSDVTLYAGVNSRYGADSKSGTGTFKARGDGQSRVDLNVGGETRSDTRVNSGGAWQKNGEAVKARAGHNSVTDAAWFFPALSSLAQSASSQYVFKYIGEEEHASVSTQHIRVSRVFPQDTSGMLARLSTMDFYLDAGSNLPVAITFQTHADGDLSVNIITEIRFGDYRTVSGILIPYSFQEMLNGRVILEVTVTNAEINTSLHDSLFALQ